MIGWNGAPREIHDAGAQATASLADPHREELPSRLQRVRARTQLVGVGELIPEGPDVFIKPRRGRRAAPNLVAAQESQAHDPAAFDVGGQQALGERVAERVVRQVPGAGVADLQLVHGAIAENLCQGANRAVRMQLHRVGGRRMEQRPAALQELRDIRPCVADRQMHLTRDFEVATPEELACRLGEFFTVEIEERVRAVERENLRLALVLIAAEEVRPVQPDGATKRPADLLVRVGKHPLLDEVGRVESAVPEVAGKRSRNGVGARLGDDVQLSAMCAALGRVEPVRDELELGDGIPAVGGIQAVEELRRHLLTVDIYVVVGPIAGIGGRCARVVRRLAAGKQRQIQEVPAVEGQLLDLPGADDAAHPRVRGIDQWRLAGDRHGLLHRRRRHLQIHHDFLAD